MSSLIVRTVARLMLPILLLFSLFLLQRGHDLPGGGFAGGLVAASAVILQLVAYDSATARRLLLVDPWVFLPAGLGLALASGFISTVLDLPFMTSRFLAIRLPIWGTISVGSPLLFDSGVYLVVLGATLLIVFGLAEA